MTYQFFYRIGCCDCVRVSNLSVYPELFNAYTTCKNRRNNTCCFSTEDFSRNTFNNFNNFNGFNNNFF